MASKTTILLTKGAIYAVAIGYLFLPTDIIPDAIPVAGVLDDVSALVVARIADSLLNFMKK